jgi:putative DNA methylase
VAILDAGLTCSAFLPCPAEMGASIHISGTGSSIVDTVFVCRHTGTVPRSTLAETVEQFANLVSMDMDKLRTGGLKPTRGDLRCVTYGHLVRMTVWNLRGKWDARLSAQEELSVVGRYMATLPQPEEIEAVVSGTESRRSDSLLMKILCLTEESPRKFSFTANTF